MGNCAKPQQQFKGSKQRDFNINKSDFVFKHVVGKGKFGFVWKADRKVTKAPYAIKVMDKMKIFNWRCVDTVLNERQLLSEMKHPFLVNMAFSFEEYDKLYMVTDFMPGGDLRYHLNRKKRFSQRQAQHIVCCIILALEYMHNNGVIHRDLRPENVLFDGKGYCKLTDLGLARVWQPTNSSDNSGMPGYMAPEVLFKQNHGVQADYFALGVIAHELMLGKKPYEGKDRKTYMQNIVKSQYELKKADTPEGWDLEAADFINKLLVRNPMARLGLNGPNEVKSHVWVKEFEWQNLLARKIPSPFIPSSRRKNFDKKSFQPQKKNKVLSIEEKEERELENPEQKKISAELLRKDSIQKLFEGYFYNIDIETEKDREKEEMEAHQNKPEDL